MYSKSKAANSEMISVYLLVCTCCVSDGVYSGAYVCFSINYLLLAYAIGYASRAGRALVWPFNSKRRFVRTKHGRSVSCVAAIGQKVAYLCAPQPTKLCTIAPLAVYWRLNW